MTGPSIAEIRDEMDVVLRDKIYANEKSDFGVNNETKVALIALQYLIGYTPPPPDQETTAETLGLYTKKTANDVFKYIDKIAQTLPYLSQGAYSYHRREFFPIESELLEDIRPFVQYFLLNSMGDLELNKKIQELCREDLTDTGVNSPGLQAFNYFIFKTRNLDKSDIAFEKLDVIFDNLLNNKAIDDQDKLLLNHYAVIADHAKLKHYFDKLNAANLIEGEPKLEKLYYRITRANKVVQHLEMIYAKNIHSRPGAFTIDHTRRKAQVKGASLSYVDIAVSKFITTHGHASKLYSKISEKNKKPKVMISHINPSHENKEFDLLTFLYSDVYAINIEQLINDTDRKKLEQKLGSDWLSEIIKQFKEQERSLHDRILAKTRNIQAKDDRQQQWAGASTLLGSYVGHTKLSKTDFDAIHDKLFSLKRQKEPTPMLCSEFVAQTTIAALVGVNKWLAENHDIKNSPIDMPFSARENLAHMTPDRLLAALQEKNCLIEMPGPKAIRSYINMN